MSDERDGRLDDAFGALRDRWHGEREDADETLARVLDHAPRRGRDRRRASAIVWAPIAAVFLVGSAFAASSLHARATSAPVGAHATRSAARLRDTLPPATTPARDVAAPIDEMPSPAAPPPAVASVAPSASAVVPAHVATASASSAVPHAIDDDVAAFERAHRVHVAGDASAALAAWDVYLASHANGRFVPEAKWNRAIALAKLGRKEEARAALTPFVDGAFGEYRREDAKKLSAALE